MCVQRKLPWQNVEHVADFHHYHVPTCSLVLRLFVDVLRRSSVPCPSALRWLWMEHKVVHRDVKHENIIKVGDMWKLADFGIASEKALEKQVERKGGLTHVV